MFDDLSDSFPCEKCLFIESSDDWYKIKCDECYHLYLTNPDYRKLINREQINLLRQHYNKIKLDKIYGPLSMYYYKIVSPFGIKKILLFGDEHTELPSKCANHNCIYYDDYILDIINKCQEKNKCVDLYVESYLTKDQGGIAMNSKFVTETDSLSYMMGGSDIGASEDTLNYIRRKFRNCLDNCDNCEINGNEIINLRSHNIDLRLYQDENVFIELMEFIEEYDITESDEREIIQYLLGMKNNYLQILSIINHYKIPHNLTKIIINEIKYIRSKIGKEYRKYLLSRDTYFDKTATDLREFYYDYITNYGDDKLVVLLVDFYTILRIFMSFDLDKHRGPSECTSNIQDKIIVYAGNTHIDCYTDILNHYFNKDLIFKVRAEEDGDGEKILEFKNFEINKDYCE
jgi:hypothetical protein